MVSRPTDSDKAPPGHEPYEAILAKLDELLQRPVHQPRFLSIKQAGEYSSLSDDSLRRLIERGDLTACRPVKGKILLDRQELDRLILGSTAIPRRGRGRRGGRPR